jgi:hypothetical protein
LELEAPGPNAEACQVIVPCAGIASSTSVRNLHNNKAHVFSVVDPSGAEVWIAAVAAGFVASAPTQSSPGSVPQTVSCQWEEDYGPRADDVLRHHRRPAATGRRHSRRG